MAQGGLRAELSWISPSIGPTLLGQPSQLGNNRGIKPCFLQNHPEPVEAEAMTSRNRPASAQSRTAWGEGIENAGASYDGDQPAAMENETYDSSIHVEQNRDHQAVQVHEPPSGCWYKFGRGVRCKLDNIIIF